MKKVFHIYLKSRAQAMEIIGTKVSYAVGGQLIVYNGEEEVAGFQGLEVQGWEEAGPAK